MCVYGVCMARVNVYLPDDLARAARDADLNVSAVVQDAIRDVLVEDATDAWLDSLQALHPLGLGHDLVAEAMREAEVGLDTRDPPGEPM